MDTSILRHVNPIEYLVTPVAPYFICHHFIGTEMYSHGRGYVGVHLNIKANELLKNKNYDDIKNFEIVQVQVQYFDFFCDEVLPILSKNNVKIILITSQSHLPQIHRSDKTDYLLNHDNIILWVSQTPIYTNVAKYMAFPYGLFQRTINDYANFLISIDNQVDKEKTIKITNQNASVHNHLPSDHIRRKYDIFGKNSGPPMNYTDFLKNILNSEFVISTSGDRDDCYRHYECIGLNAIPISNIGGGYKEIFEDSMIYSNAEDMINMIETNMAGYTYKKPNRNIITISYWVSEINKRIKFLTGIDMP